MDFHSNTGVLLPSCAIHIIHRYSNFIATSLFMLYDTSGRELVMLLLYTALKSDWLELYILSEELNERKLL